MSTTTTKPVKGTGKQKTSAQTASGEANNALTTALRAARELWLGPPDGIGELENEIWGCESSTIEAIRGAKPEKKLSAFDHGFDELREKLCASASRYYNTCFELALRNRTEFGAGNPAEFAMGVTARDLSTFLRVTALDGNEDREIGSNGRVREFVRNVCLNYPDFQILDPDDAEQNAVSLLPRWPTGRSLGAMIARRGPRTRADEDESSTLTLEETERFILGAEGRLIKDLRRAIDHVHRVALVDLGKNGIAASPTHTLNFRSPLKKAVWACFQAQTDATNKEALEWLRQNNPRVIPRNWDEDDTLPGKYFAKVRRLRPGG